MGRRHGVQHSQVRDIGVFARPVDLAQDVDGPVGQDLGRDARLGQIALSQGVGDGVLKLRGAEAGGLDRRLLA